MKYSVEYWFMFGGWMPFNDGNFDSLDEAVEFAKDANLDKIRIVRVVAETKTKTELEFL